MDFLKQCPLLICVLLTSLLIPWELLKKEGFRHVFEPVEDGMRFTIFL